MHRNNKKNCMQIILDKIRKSYYNNFKLVEVTKYITNFSLEQYKNIKQIDIIVRVSCFYVQICSKKKVNVSNVITIKS